jgi:hypothetical protein
LGKDQIETGEYGEDALVETEVEEIRCAGFECSLRLLDIKEGGYVGERIEVYDRCPPSLSCREYGEVYGEGRLPDPPFPDVTAIERWGSSPIALSSASVRLSPEACVPMDSIP